MSHTKKTYLCMFLHRNQYQLKPNRIPEKNVALKHLISIVLAIAISNLIYAQKEANIWYFGEKAGMDFSAGNPVPLTDGQMDTPEGCSSISTPNGDLMFYTNGVNVWNRQHTIMPNGTGLKGNPSSTQSGMIVPYPGSLTKVLIFTVDEVATSPVGGANGLRYSLVDMSLGGGLGDVEPGTKNVLLTAPLSEKVTAIKHSNGIDIWVVVSKYGTNSFYAYLITTSGVNHTPVISSAGDIVTERSRGYMKISPDGTKLAKANGNESNIEIFDFDDATGIVSNAIKDDNFGMRRMYGVEFSSDSKKLYVNAWQSASTGGGLYQYDLEAGSPQDILDSRFFLSDVPDGALQLAPNKKIYVVKTGLASLAIIHQPNEIAPACNFQVNGISLSGRKNHMGLPPFIQSFFNLDLDFSYNHTCFGDSTEFSLITSITPDSVLWNFDDPASGIYNISKLSDPKHRFSSSGLFNVKVKIWTLTAIDSIEYAIEIAENPQVNLGDDDSFCEGNTFLIDAGPGFSSYVWSTGENGQSIEVNVAGLYWVEVSNTASCKGSDTIVLSINPSFTIQVDTSICKGESIFVGGDYQTEAGTYYDTLLTISGCDSIFVTNLTVNDYLASFVDTTICQGDSILLEGEFQNEEGIYYDTISNINTCDSVIITDLTLTDYLTQNKETTICDGDSVYLEGAYRKEEGTYYDTIINVESCDSLLITQLLIDPLPLVSLGNDTSILEGDVLPLDATFPNADYLWQDGYTGAIYNASDSGWYWVEVSTHCGQAYDTVFIDYLLDLQCFVTVPNAFTPNGDGKNDVFKPVLNCDASVYEFSIFNRWGQMVFTSKNQEEGWDGGIDETNASPGVYLWQVAYKIQINIDKFIEGTDKGTLTLVR
jgi:gliding motility-associated-like protein